MAEFGSIGYPTAVAPQVHSYIAQKNVESGYSLLAAMSLPYEKFGERDGPRVPALVPTPETQLNDCIIQDCPFDGNDLSYVEFIPDLFAGVSSYVDTSAVSFAGSWSGRATYRIPLGTPVATPVPVLNFSMTHASTSNKFVSSQAAVYVPLNSAGVVYNGTIFITNLTQRFEGVLSARLETRNAGVWTNIGGVTLESAVANVSFSSIIDGLRVTVLVDGVGSNQAGSFAFTIKPNPVGALMYGSNDWSSLRTTHWPYLRDLPDVQSYRRVAASLLATYTGSSLVDGGKIASALVPIDWSPPDSNPYAAVASLRNDRYDAAMRHGTDVTWRHQQLDDFQSVNFDQSNLPGAKIVIGIARDDAQASLRLRAFFMCGIYSTNTIVGKMIYTPALTPQMLEALSKYYENTPAATSNAEHTKLKALKNMGVKSLAIVRTLLEHDNEMAALLTAAGQPELAAGVKLAGYANRKITKKQNKAKQAQSSVKSGKQKAKPSKGGRK